MLVCDSRHRLLRYATAAIDYYGQGWIVELRVRSWGFRCIFAACRTTAVARLRRCHIVRRTLPAVKWTFKGQERIKRMPRSSSREGEQPLQSRCRPKTLRPARLYKWTGRETDDNDPSHSSYMCDDSVGKLTRG